MLRPEPKGEKKTRSLEGALQHHILFASLFRHLGLHSTLFCRGCASGKQCFYSSIVSERSAEVIVMHGGDGGRQVPWSLRAGSSKGTEIASQ